MATTQPAQRTATNQFRLGLLFAVGSAFTFGFSGPLAKSLMEAGWSPTAAVAARLAAGALLLSLFASVIKPSWFRDLRRHAKTVLAYGLIPVAGSQFCYFNAVAHLPVGVALLLEYTAPVLVVGWVWATTRRRPSALTLGGATLALVGIMLVLGVVGTDGFQNAHVDPVGVLWALAAAFCAACYFVMSAKVGDDGDGLEPLTLATGGLLVGATAVTLLGVTGVMPLTFTTNDAVLAGWTTSWVVPLIMVAVIPTAVAYALGIMGISRLRPRFASLVGLSEVMFAVLTAWVMLGEAITPVQAVGGAVVLLGLALARQGDRTENSAASTPELGKPVGKIRQSV